MQETTGPRALGHTSRRTIAGTIAVLGFAIAIVGSAGPWIADLVSSSGFQIEGKVTAGIAVVGIVLVLLGRPAVKLLMLVAMAELVLGGYEYAHVHSLYGRAVGWGVYAIIAGAFVAGAGAAYSFSESSI